MGIKGLLPQLRSVTVKTHLREFAGLRVAIDGYCWLHHGTACCARELCEGEPTDKCACTRNWLGPRSHQRNALHAVFNAVPLERRRRPAPPAHAHALPPRRYVHSFMKRVRLLQQHGVVPVVIFDGNYLPSKGAEESSRSRSRASALETARRHAANGA